ncbi:LysM peptidoglycan-binding domain-containing protein [Clostridium frigoris]|uniref:LysM peptidoglycan-binding domain-containing protein n=1 Tax=Clostridium frigoris TaxID=205327 RepID=A0ABS6BRR2_9CLOT|nr:cell wall hydrolase [Clostridium frigoris]MBU3159616.1 LysM peptidoglycan-binding domain-containing protein [Clostridium frigoris]
MNKFKSIKSIFLASALTIGVATITSQNVFATSLTTKTYIVKNGDCLSVIAKKCGQSLNDLRKANNKWNDTIFPGQTIKVSGENSANLKPSVQTNNNPTKTYIVKSGDCLSVIAKKCGQSLNDLKEANNKLNDTILPGQIIKVPVTVSSTSAQVKLKVQDKTVAKSERIAIKYTESDLNLLSRLITAEAQGESYSAQVAVGAIVVNRVKSSYFPNSISSVINERTKGGYQFTPVLNGNINKPAQASALKAASEALSGVDPTNNALFFYDGSVPKGLTAPQPISIVIGNLTFVYLLK